MPAAKNKNTAADATLLGFFFQIERVIFWLSELSGDDFVGVEVADDIVIKLNEGTDVQEIYEQAKHTTSANAPYANKSKDLWKTLAIWVTAVTDGRINPSTSKFSILSNRVMPSQRFVHKLNSCSKSHPEQLEDCYNELVGLATTLPKSLKEYGNKITECPKDTLKDIIANISIIDPTYNHVKKEYLKTIKNNLHLPDDLPISDFVEKLFGYISMFLIDKWRKKEEGWISVNSFNTQYAQLIADYRRRPFIERTADLLPVTKAEIRKNKGKVYVEQLKIIDCQEEEVLEAIHDYLRALSERDRFAKEGEISGKKFDEYYDDLLQNWKNVSKPRFKFCLDNQRVRVGYEVYYETLKYKGKLNNFEPQQHYTYRGAYHHLSNELDLGWHPKWKEIISGQ